MSKEKKELAVPDYLKAMVESGDVVDQTAAMLSGAGSVPRLTTKGKTFRFKDGEKDEEKAGQSIDVVIVGINPIAGLAHTWYKDGYTPDSSSPPDCSSTDGVTPDPWVQNPQSKNCAKCPHQVWGSAQSMNGGKAKACKDHKQVYVARAKEFGEDPTGCTLYLMQITVNSLKAFGNYGKELATKGIPGPQFVITRITFDDEASVPKLEFEMIGILNEKLGKASHTRCDKREWEAVKMLPSPSAGNQSRRALPQHPADDDDDGDDDNTGPAASADAKSVDELIDGWDE